MDHHRQESHMAHSSHELATESIASLEADPQIAMAAKEQRESLEASIGRLPVLEKEAVLLRLGQGLSYKQIAQVMDLSVSHVGVLLHQALGKLRTAMNPDRQSQS
jgi:RNA polymerase sigma-70 factor (ECF subfamily)